MSIVRTAPILSLLVAVQGCFVMPLPPKVPAIARPTLPADTFIDVDSGTVRGTVRVTDKADVCAKGGRDCVEVRTHRKESIRVRVASASIDGKPLSIGEVAAAADPKFLTDNQALRELTSNCRRGRAVMMGGGLGLTAAYFLLQLGFRDDDPSKPAAIGGIAAAAGGLALLALGRFAFGGQDCEPADKLRSAWAPVYRDPDATTVRSDHARFLEELADKFNRNIETARAEQTD